MADVATHVRIFDPDPSDDLVTKRTAVVKDLAAKLVNDRDIDALIAVADGIAKACIKGGSPRRVFNPGTKHRVHSRGA
jgi:hypothetical protein